MVLKKSNSRFNSGNTQRLCNRGGYKNCDYYRPDPRLHSHLFISLRGEPSVLNAYNTSTEHNKTLDKIYEYLGFKGPDLKSFYTDVYDRCRCISLNKRNLWSLSDRIEDLMKEEKFLEGEKGVAEIQIHRIKRHAQSISRKLHHKESIVLSPNPRNEKVKPDQKKIQKFVNQHSRGAQRPHLFHRPISQQAPWYNERKPRIKQVIIRLEDKDHIDTRNLSSQGQGNASLGSLSMKPKMKSLFKSKGWKNGKHSQMRGYDNAQIKQDVETTFHDSQDFPVFDFGVHETVDDKEKNVCSNSYQGWDITTKVKQTRTRVRNDKNKNKHKFTKDEEEERVNSASSQLTVRHAKGSFEYIDRPSSVNILSDDDFVHVNHDDLVDTDKQRCDDSVKRDNDINEIDQSLSKTHTNTDTFDRKDVFTRINLRLDNDFQEMLMSSNLYGSKSNMIFVKECPVSFGNCFPPVFCIKLKTKNQISDQGWCLVGASKSESLSDKCLTWEVTMKNYDLTSDVDDAFKIKSQFLSCLNVESNSFLSLECLVEKALDLIVTSSNRGEYNNSINEKNNGENFNHGRVFSLDDALNWLDVIENRSKVSQDNHLTITSEEASQKEIPAVNHDDNNNNDNGNVFCGDDIIDCDCDICFTTCHMYGQNDSGLITLMPCGHSFCHSCWLNHIFYSITRGSPIVKCMHTDCSQLLNETIMNAFVPESSLKKLYLQQRERRIDSSPLCQWCPNKQCNKIALIGHCSPHTQQFGCSITCDCTRTWCFPCQNEPHFPASCDQNMAYKLLLHKLDKSLQTLPTSVTLCVEVKPCPQCRYPIEKNEGCPHMFCEICHCSFCWNCLTSLDDRMHYGCEVDEDTYFVTYALHNDVDTFPLKFFRNALEIRTKNTELNRANVQGWLNGLCVSSHKFRDLPFYRSVQLEDVEKSKGTAIILAKDTVDFLMGTYNFLEYFYILASFALLNETINCNESLTRSVNRMCTCLELVTSRLEELVVKKHIGHLVKVNDVCEMLLSNGRETVLKLSGKVKKLQTLSADIPTDWVGDLDPEKYSRYK